MAEKDPTLTLTLVPGAPVERFEHTPGRYVAFFENCHGEQLVYVHDRGEKPVLYHSDIDWQPVELSVTPAEQMADARKFVKDLNTQGKRLEDMGPGAQAFLNSIDPLAPGIILDDTERDWLQACVAASERYSKAQANR